MKTINIGILAHVDAGKTTVTEHLLYKAGAIRQVGRVDTGDTQTDSMELERKRGISIKASTVSFDWGDIKINIIDTPGHVDFISEVERSLRVLDGAILVVSAKEGVQSQTKTLFEILQDLKIPTIIFVNKLDRIGVDYSALLRSLSEELTDKILPVQAIALAGTKDVTVTALVDEVTDQIIDTLSDMDDEILDAYVSDGYISREFLDIKIKKYCGECKLIPVVNGSALLGLGVDHLLEAIVRFLPFNETKENVENNPISGVVFKISRDNSNSKATYVRLYEGTIKVRDELFNSKTNLSEKVTKISVLKNGQNRSTQYFTAGDIGIIHGPQSFKIGDRIGMVSPKARNFSIPKPVLKTKVSTLDPKSKNKLYELLSFMSEEDPFLDLEIGEIEREIYINLFGNIQMEILSSLLKESYDLDVTFSEPTTIYKEAPKGVGEAISNMYQSRLNPFAATVAIRVEPLPRGSGFVYESQVSTGSLLKTFQNAVEEAVYTTKRQGLLGWELTDAKVTFTYGDYDSVNSTPADFRNLTPMVFMEALDNAKTLVLEPYNQFELKVPEYVGGKTLSDIQQMRGSLTNPYVKGKNFVVSGVVPVDTSKSYPLQLASFTEGKGVFTTKFYGYKEYTCEEIKVREKTFIDPLNKKLYLMHKMNTLR